MNLGTEPPDLDPAKITDLTSYTVIQQLLKGLTQFDEKLNVAPAMAERWTVSPDGLHYTFYLKRNAVWSDGQPVTTKNFTDAWRRALDPNLAAEYAFFLFELKNAKPYFEGKLTNFAEVGVHAVDDHTLTVTLERPTPFFLALLANPIALPVRQDLIDQFGDRWVEAGHMVSNGAYLLKQWRHEEKITLVPNPRSGLTPPAVDRVDMLMVNDANTSVVMYENNELDFIETTTSIPSFDVRRLRKNPDAHVLNIHRLNYFGFNTQKPPMDNLKVRQAFAHALDRSYFPRLMQSGQTPIASWITPGLVGYNPNVGLPYDPKKAQQLLAEAGYPGGKGFPEVELGYPTHYDIQKECEIAQFLWKHNLHVPVRLANMEWKVYLSRLNQDAPQLYRLGWFVDYPDADSFMSLFTKDNGNNHTGWSSPVYDALIQKAVVETNPAVRQKLYDEAQRILLEKDTAIIPMVMVQKTYLAKPRVHGLVVTPMNLINLDHLSIGRR
ncbi:MAG: peptide ABC transporter substrate-binding protein [Candidatus Melainabacteria bacterium]